MILSILKVRYLTSCIPTFKVFPLAAAGFFEGSIAESESLLLVSWTTAFPRLPFSALLFFGKLPASALSSSVHPLDEVAFFVVVAFFAAAVVVLASESSLFCKGTN